MTTPGKGRADFLALGDWNVVCWQCGRKRKASYMKRHWQGYYVCPEHWEPRQEQDFVRAIAEKQTPPWVQPMPAAVYIAFCTPNGTTGIAGWAVAECAICEYTSPLLDVSLDPEPCVPIVILEDEGIGEFETVLGCHSLVVEATLLLEGNIGVS